MRTTSGCFDGEVGVENVYVLVPADNGITMETAVIFRNSRTITVVP
jgi:hypothetical protein